MPPSRIKSFKRICFSLYLSEKIERRIKQFRMSLKMWLECQSFLFICYHFKKLNGKAQVKRFKREKKLKPFSNWQQSHHIECHSHFFLWIVEFLHFNCNRIYNRMKTIEIILFKWFLVSPHHACKNVCIKNWLDSPKSRIFGFSCEMITVWTPRSAYKHMATRFYWINLITVPWFLFCLKR